MWYMNPKGHVYNFDKIVQIIPGKEHFTIRYRDLAGVYGDLAEFDTAEARDKEYWELLGKIDPKLQIQYQATVMIPKLCLKENWGELQREYDAKQRNANYNLLITCAKREWDYSEYTGEYSQPRCFLMDSEDPSIINFREYAFRIIK